MAVEYVKLNWLCKHMKTIRSSQASIAINSITKLSKTQFFPVSIVKLSTIFAELFNFDVWQGCEYAYKV